MENNAAKKEFLDACRGLVMNCDCKILVVEIELDGEKYLIMRQADVLAII